MIEDNFFLVHVDECCLVSKIINHVCRCYDNRRYAVVMTFEFFMIERNHAVMQSCVHCAVRSKT